MFSLSNPIYLNIKVTQGNINYPIAPLHELAHLQSNLLHLDNSSADQLLDLVHHHWILCMFLCSLGIFLEIDQYLHTHPTIINTSHSYYTNAIHINIQLRGEQTCLITGSWRMFCISGSCIALACRNTYTY